MLPCQLTGGLLGVLLICGTPMRELEETEVRNLACFIGMNQASCSKIAAVPSLGEPSGGGSHDPTPLHSADLLEAAGQ